MRTKFFCLGNKNLCGLKAIGYKLTYIHTYIYIYIYIYIGWNLMKMEVEEQGWREKRVVDEEERAERKIYLMLIF